MSSSLASNPCLACTTNQSCCSRLSGLRLTKGEFESHFKKHSDRLSVVKYKKTFIVSALKNLSCPHWELGGCLIYHGRPVDCRLYPYEITKISEKKRTVEVRFGANPGCPMPADLLMPVEQAKKLIQGFCRNVYGPQGKQIVVTHLENPKGGGPRRSLIDPLIARISKILRSCR